MRRPLLLLVLVSAVALVVAIYFWPRSRLPVPSQPDGALIEASTGARRGEPVGKTLPPRRERAASPISGSGAPRSLLGLFDTGALCEQHNAAHCAALRAAVARCDAGDGEGCRAALMLVDSGALRDLSLAALFARRSCDVGGDCARSRLLERFRLAESDPAARKDTNEACTRGDPIACAFAARAAGDESEATRYAELACKGGVIALGGCFDVSLSAMGSPAARAALEHACASGSADGCELLGRLAFERGELDVARATLTRACDLAPGGDACDTLDWLQQRGTLEEP